MDLSKKTLAELRAIAKERGLKGVTALRKPELAAKIAEVMQKDEERPKQEPAAGKKGTARDRAELVAKKQESPAQTREQQGKEREPQSARTVTRNREKGGTRGTAHQSRIRTNTRKTAENRGDTPGEHRTEQHKPEYHKTEYRKVEQNKSEHHKVEAYIKNEQYRQEYSETKPDRVAQNVNHYNSNQKQRYHDGSDGLISIMKDRQITDVHPTELKDIDSGITKNGILEIMSEGYGFIRCDNFLPGENDVYVAPQFIRRFGLRTGDIIEGNLRTRTTSEKFSALLYMKKVNGRSPSYLYNRKKFEDLTPIFPNFRLHMETPGTGVSMRILDLIAPIGKGQRGMIVSQPKTGKTTLLKQVAKAVTMNYPKMNLIVLLIDERPEEVTDIKESIEGGRVEVIYSTFDELPDNHRRVSEMVIERAKRLVESGEDVIILLDSITRLARAYNLTVTPSGRTLSGGLDPAALHMPKRFFGAARNMREGGSLTILATALVDTGSRMDDVVFEEFKGTGNMELVLDRSLSERRIFPSIDIMKSSTRREDLLLDANEQEVVTKIRKALAGMKSDQAMEQILNLFKRTKNNEEFIETVKKMHL